ncbi:hypothetical protein DAPPUDRAFT_96467 [Daphnia pulex]|uniref:Uncharacterized protein n=1 Tax=Daphnia pulex TaxID=6669 RepID=E9FXY8_DAPPU|nr:hypothetical protein DAPPUDRAFT_96467 [Daphnia pulex]|eukprot:EFX88209.1 hypothetical protein DAPPUDRAFT_96467 [Daphnia pulex]
MVRIKMLRVVLKAVGLRGRWTHWNSWKGWLYLALLVFISGRLFVSQGFSLTLTPAATTTLEKTDSVGDNINNIAPKNHGDRGLKMAVVLTSTWSSSPVIGHGPKSQEDISSGNQLLLLLHTGNKTSRPLVIPTTEDNSKYWNPVPPSKKTNEDVDNETYHRRQNHDSSSGSLLEERERRYWLRSERIKRVCRSRGVVSNPLVYANSKNETRPVRSPNSKNSPAGFALVIPTATLAVVFINYSPIDITTLWVVAFQDPKKQK